MKLTLLTPVPNSSSCNVECSNDVFFCCPYPVANSWADLANCGEPGETVEAKPGRSLAYCAAENHGSNEIKAISELSSVAAET